MTIPLYTGFFDRFRRKVTQYLQLLKLRAQVHRERIELSKLDDDALRDIGISHGDAAAEINRPFTDVPRRRLDKNTTNPSKECPIPTNLSTHI